MGSITAPLAIISALICIISGENEPFNLDNYTNKLGKETILIQMPATQIPYNQRNFYPMVRALVRFAKSIMGKDNVILMGDKKMVSYLKAYLPDDVLLESQITDLWLRDLAPTRNTFFKFERDDGTTIHQENLKNVLRDCTDGGKKLDYSDLIIDGGNIVHNDFDTAIVTSKVINRNPNMSYTEMINELKRSLKLENILILPQFSGEPTGHADLTVSFIDRSVIVYSDLTRKGHLQKALKTFFGDKMQLVEIESVAVRDSYFYYHTACGIHVNIVSTDEYLYVPIFGIYPENRKRQQSRERDMDVLTTIARNTKKIIVPIPIPFEICRLGGNTRCLTWQVKDGIADDLVIAARKNQCFRDIPPARK